MIHCQRPPASIVPVMGSVSISLSLVAACGEPAESTPIIGSSREHPRLSWCTSDAGCSEREELPPSGRAGWFSRCTADAECSLGECVCGLCTAACSDESTACSGGPRGASCYAGGSITRAALCHASTVAGICLSPCRSDADCGEGLVCALGACLPAPSAE